MLSDRGISEQKEDRLGLYFDKVKGAIELLRGVLKESKSNYKSRELSKQISQLERLLEDSPCSATGGRHNWVECSNDSGLNQDSYICSNCRKQYRQTNLKKDL